MTTKSLLFVFALGTVGMLVQAACLPPDACLLHSECDEGLKCIDGMCKNPDAGAGGSSATCTNTVALVVGDASPKILDSATTAPGQVVFLGTATGGVPFGQLDWSLARTPEGVGLVFTNPSLVVGDASWICVLMEDVATHAATIACNGPESVANGVAIKLTINVDQIVPGSGFTGVAIKASSAGGCSGVTSPTVSLTAPAN